MNTWIVLKAHLQSVKVSRVCGYPLPTTEVWSHLVGLGLITSSIALLLLSSAMLLHCSLLLQWPLIWIATCTVHILIALWYVDILENFQVAANRTILTPEGFPIAHLKAYALRFSGNIWKMSVVLKLGVPALPEVSWSRTMTAKMSVFRPLFWRKSLFWLTSTKCWPPLNIHHWKALVKSFHMVFFKNYFMDPAMRQNFGDAHGQIF